MKRKIILISAIMILLSSPCAFAQKSQEKDDLSLFEIDRLIRRTEYDEAYVKELLDKLAALGSKVVVLTGVSLSKGKTGVYGLDTVTGETFIYQNDLVDATYHGTGDIFASVAVGGLTRGLSRDKAFALAADYTADTIRETLHNPKKPWYGVDFEATIPQLVSRLAVDLATQ